MNGKTLVTGATGTVGKALINALKQAGADFIAGARDTEKAQSANGLDKAQVRYFDFTDAASFDAATAGVTRVFLLGPPMITTLDQLLSPFIDHLKQKGIERVVFLSALNIESMGDLMSFHVRLEAKLKRDGFRLTVLKPSFFAQNFKSYDQALIEQQHMIYSPAGDGSVPFVDANDIAAVAAKALTEDGHEGKTYRITGPESLNYHEVAGLLSEVLGRSISYPAPTPAEFKATLVQTGAPEGIADYLISVYGVIARHETDAVYDDFEKLLGRSATPLRDVLLRDFGRL